ncbi:MAG: DUF4833 domain-containing protein [Tannerellaceae bacterium]|nr:DUF4833 domain-containing protein [Tannerellaceae bacterium]
MIVLIKLIIPFSVWGQQKGVESEDRLFHIERSKNRNLVCYDVNLIDTKLNTNKPLDIYWVNQEEKAGQVNGLSAIEKKFAYGYKLISQGEDQSEFTLTAYPGRVITVQYLNGKYVCTIQIDNHTAILEKLYVQAKSGNSLAVEYIELFGKTPDTGKLVYEKVENKK